MLSTMVSAYYDSEGCEIYPQAESYGDYCYFMQDMCNQMTCGYHGPPGGVRIVNGTSGPPMPVPLQMPSGHLVQQVLDENGTVRHILLSPPVPLPVGAQYSPSHASTTLATPSGAYYAYPPQPPYAPPHFHPQQHLQPPMAHQGLMMQPPSPQCNGQTPPSGPSPPPQPPPMTTCPTTVLPTQRDDRYQRQTYKFRRKLVEGSGRSAKEGERRKCKDKYEDGIRINGSSTSNASEDEEVAMMVSEYLSSMRPPTVVEISTRGAIVRWKPPDIPWTEIDKKLGVSAERSDVTYEVMLCEKGKEGLLRSVYCGPDHHCSTPPLKPSTEYYVCVQASLDDIRGITIKGAVFKTHCSDVEVLQPPRLCSRTKNTLALKWGSGNDSNSKIKTYILEYDEGLGGRNFVEIYSGPSKQYKAVKLSPATNYTFRLSAVNEKGLRAYSSKCSFFTSGVGPSQPMPPVIKEAFLTRLHLEWEKRPCDHHFILQYADEHMRHGFLDAYSGSDVAYVCSALRCNTEYKFRLCARNEEGCSSAWSKVVTYSTLPDKLSCPSKPCPKGRIHASCFRVAWDPPRESKQSSITKYKLEVDRGSGFEVVYTGPDTEFFLENLLPGTTYRLKVACISSTGCSPYSDVSAVTTAAVHPGKCSAPRLQCKPESNFLCLEWIYPGDDGGSSVLEYEVASTGPDNVTSQAYRGSETTCVVNDLLPGRPYLFQVRAWNRVGPGEFSDSLEVVSGAGPPDVPQNFAVLESTAHGCSLAWEEPVNNGAAVTAYQIQMATYDADNSDDEDNFNELFEGLCCKYEVSGLQPATQYRFKIRAVNDAGAGSFGGAVSCETSASVPGRVSSIGASTTSTSMCLSWRLPMSNGRPVISYNVEVDDYLYNTDCGDLELCVEDLVPETVYRLRIQAVNEIGEGPFSEPVEAQTLPSPPEPPALECVSVAHNHLRLRWNGVEGKTSDATCYTLEMSSRTRSSFVPIYHGVGLSHKVNRLTENAAYRFRICASSESGQGPYSDTFTFQTSRASPPLLKAPKVSGITDTSCIVEWPPVAKAFVGGHPHSYQLQLEAHQGAESKIIYQGPDTRCSITDLEPLVRYSLRVASVRHYPDQDLLGAYSPSTAFTTQTDSPDSVTADSSSSSAGGHRESSASSAVERRRQLRDRHWAALLSLGFTTLGFIVAAGLERGLHLSQWT